MNWREMPPLSGLRAFAAFAEAGNVVGAGGALGVSHAAISQQLRSLESHLDVALLDRSGRALGLTPQGVQLAAALNLGFGAMHEAISMITGAQVDRPLHISTTPTFAASWLMPRLPRFRERHPEIDLMLDPTPQLVQLSADGIDAGVRYGNGVWPGVESKLLIRSPMVVVGAPALVGQSALTDVKALASLPWLEEFGRSEADNWLAAHGLDRDKRKGLTRVPGNLLLDGARDGQGIAVTVKAFVQADLSAGRLTALYEEPQQNNSGYYLITRSGVMRPMLKAFVNWLVREAKET